MKNILLLHGALGCADDLLPLASELSKLGLKPICFNFSGHGNKATEYELNIPSLITEISRFLKIEKLSPIPVFGYSMGGYVTLRLSLKAPELFTQIVTLGTKLEWNDSIAAKEATGCNLQFLAEKAPAFLQSLKSKHADAEKLLINTAQLLNELGKEKFAPLLFSKINVPLLLNIGDRDKMVSLQETIQLYKNTPSAALSILPNTKHPLESADLELLAKIICDFVARKI